MSAALTWDLAEGLALLALGAWMMLRLRANVEWVIRRGKRWERRRRAMREARKTIYAMPEEALAAERRRLRARAARERARRSEGLQMVCYRLRLIEGRMRQIAAQSKAPGGGETPAGGSER